MSLLPINIRGGGNIVKWKSITHLIKPGKVDICFIQKTKLVVLDESIAPLLWGSYEVEWSEAEPIDGVGGVAILWRKDLLKLSFSFRGIGFVGVNAKWRGQELFFVNIYYSCNLALKKMLWRKLVALKKIFGSFTWFNSASTSISRRDRFLLSENLIEDWKIVVKYVGNRDISDYCPIWLKANIEDWGPKPFKFNNSWLNHPDF
ncbi:unnamed protein product [Lathyrus sativus]|nr:unnamed protein product [Lathyrus sativus]